MEIKTAVFKGKRIRKTIHNNEWWFSVVNVCGVLTDSIDAGAYWRKLKQRLKEEGSEVVTFCHGLKLEASDGKKYETDCANTEGIFRIIQSVPSPKEVLLFVKNLRMNGRTAGHKRKRITKF